MSELVKVTQSVPSEIDHDKVRRLVTKGSASPLTNERETGPFLMFLAGDTLDEIAYKQQIPRDILEVTAVHYDWEMKRKVFGSSGADLADVLLHKIADTLLITAYLQVMKDMADVSAGRKEAKDCLFIPKSTGALAQLTEFRQLINSIGKPADPNKPAQAAVPTVNVNVNTAPGAEPPTVTVAKIDPEEKAKMLREMAAKKR